MRVKQIKNADCEQDRILKKRKIDFEIPQKMKVLSLVHI
jgi:hypothetical protein